MYSKRFSKNTVKALEDLMRHAVICVQAIEDLFVAFIAKDHILVCESSIKISNAYVSCVNLERVLVNTLITGSNLPGNPKHIIATAKLIKELTYNCENLNKTAIYIDNRPPKEIHPSILSYFANISEVACELSEIFTHFEDFFARIPKHIDEGGFPIEIKKHQFPIETESWGVSCTEPEDEFYVFCNENTNETEYIYNENSDFIEDEEFPDEIIQEESRVLYDPLGSLESNILFEKLNKINSLKLCVRDVRNLIDKYLFEYNNKNVLAVWGNLMFKSDKIVNCVDDLIEAVKIMLFLCEG